MGLSWSLSLKFHKGLAVTYSDDFHDRFLVIDNVELHGLGSSINCLGRRVPSYATRDAKEIAKLLAMVSFLCFIAHRHYGVPH